MGNQPSQIAQKDPDFAKFVHFSQTEVKEWTSAFKSMYPSGKMSFKDFESFYSKLFPFGNVQKFCERLFKNINIGQSQEIDINELLIAFTILFKGSSFEKLRWIFRFYDSDNDGFVSREDLESGLVAINELVTDSLFTALDSRELVKKVFEVTKNQSGFLTLNDFEIIASHSDSQLKNIFIFQGYSGIIN